MSRKPGLIKLRLRLHPHAEFLFAEMANQQCTAQQMAERSGVSKATIFNWSQGRSNPGMIDLEACLNVLGFSLVIRKQLTQPSKHLATHPQGCDCRHCKTQTKGTPDA